MGSAEFKDKVTFEHLDTTLMSLAKMYGVDIMEQEEAEVGPPERKMELFCKEAASAPSLWDSAPKLLDAC